MRSKDKGLMEKIKTFAEEYAMEHGGATPSTRDIGAEFGISHISIATVASASMLLLTADSVS